MNSFASTYGPSVTAGTSPRTRTVLLWLGSANAANPTNSPVSFVAFWKAWWVPKIAFCSSWLRASRFAGFRWMISRYFTGQLSFVISMGSPGTSEPPAVPRHVEIPSAAPTYPVKGEFTMGKVTAYLSLSLDGFVAGANAGVGNPLGDGGERLHEWVVGLKS